MNKKNPVPLFVGYIELTSGLTILITPKRINISQEFLNKIIDFTEKCLGSRIVRIACLSPAESDRFTLPSGLKSCHSCHDINESSRFGLKGNARYKNVCKSCDNMNRRQKYKEKVGRSISREIAVGLNYSGGHTDPTKMTDSIYSVLKSQSFICFANVTEVDVDTLIRPKNNLISGA